MMKLTTNPIPVMKLTTCLVNFVIVYCSVVGNCKNQDFSIVKIDNCFISRCNNKKCKTGDILITDVNFCRNLTKESFSTHSHEDITCRSSNLVYGIECSLRGLIYVGKTKGQLNKIMSGHRFQINHGMVTELCDDSCNNETVIKTSIPSTDHYISALLIWRYVNTNEAFLVLKAVYDLASLDPDVIVVAAELPYDIDIPVPLNHLPFPILQWLSYNTSSNPSVVVADRKHKCNEITSDNMQQTNTEDERCTRVTISPKYQTTPPLPSLNDSTDVFGNIVSSVAHQVMWSATYILAEDDNDVHKISSLVYSLSIIGITSTVHQLPDISSVRFQEQLLDLINQAEETGYNITLICSKECVQKVFLKPFQIVRKQVQRYSLYHKVKWLVVTSGDGSPNTWEITNTNMDNVVLIVIPMDVMRKPAFKNDNILSFVWKVLDEVRRSIGNSTLNSTAFLTNTAIDLLSSLNQTQCSWVPIEALMWGKTDRYFQNVGFVKSNGYVMSAGDIFPNLKFGFNGQKFLVSTNVWYPFVKKDNQNYSGFCMDILEHLSQNLNFTYDLIQPADNEWGAQYPNGSWTGLVGQMERNEVDLIVAPLSVQPIRDRVMDFSYPYYWDPTKIILRKPNPLDKKWRTLIDPFHPTVLLCIGISLPFMSFVLFMLERISPYYRSFEDRGSARGLHYFSDSFWYMYGALLTQGGEHMAESMSGRTLLSFWWIFCIIMMATYSGNLIAFLTVTKDKLPFETLHEMVELDNFKWGIPGGTSYVNIFKTSEQPDYIKLWNGLVEFNKTDTSVFSTNAEVHIENVLAGDYAYLGEKSYLEKKMIDNCNLVTTDEEFLPLHYAIGLPDNSPYTNIISDQIMKIHESGLIQIWKQKHWPKGSFCSGALVTEASVINLHDLQSAFYLIGIGIVLASIVLLNEFIALRFRKKPSRKPKQMSAGQLGGQK